LKSLTTLNQSASQFFDQELDFKDVKLSQIFNYNISDIDSQLELLINQSMDFRKVENAFLKPL